MPSRANRMIRRAISTASSPSPGAEKNSKCPSFSGKSLRLRGKQKLPEMFQRIGSGRAWRPALLDRVPPPGLPGARAARLLKNSWCARDSRSASRRASGNPTHGCCPFADGLRCQRQKAGEIDQRSLVQLGLVQLQQRCQIGRWRAGARQLLRCDPGQPQFHDGPGQGPGEPGKRGYRMEICEFALRQRLLRDPGGDRLPAQPTQGSQAPAPPSPTGRVRGRLDQGDPMDSGGPLVTRNYSVPRPSPAKWRGPIITISGKRAAKDSTAWSNAPLDHDLTTLPVYTQKFFALRVTIAPVRSVFTDNLNPRYDSGRYSPLFTQRSARFSISDPREVILTHLDRRTAPN